MNNEHENDGCSIWHSQSTKQWVLSFIKDGDDKSLAFDSEDAALQHAKQIGLKWRWTEDEKWERVDLPTCTCCPGTGDRDPACDVHGDRKEGDNEEAAF